MLGRAMLDRLAAWLKEGHNDLSGAQDELHLAVAALLIGAARVDDGLEARELATIDRLLERHFGLSPEDARQLEAAAERSEAQSAQLFGFIRTINDRLPPEKRVELVEMLWEVAYADGVLDPLEDTLLRRIGSMIDVSDRDRGAARLRVASRLGIAEEE